MEEIVDLTKKLGLAEKEAQIFLFLFETGPKTVREISDRERITRTHIYIILRKLVGLGLVEEVRKERTSIYKAIAPDKIAAYVTKISADWQRLTQNIADKFGLLRLFQEYGKDIEVEMDKMSNLGLLLKNMQNNARDPEKNIIAVNIPDKNDLQRMFSQNGNIRFVVHNGLNGSLIVMPAGAVFINETEICAVRSQSLAQVFYGWADAVEPA